MKEGWEKKKLGDVAEYINGYAFKPTEWSEQGLPIIRIQNLNNDDAEYNYYDKSLPTKYLVQNGDLLISWSASLGAYIWKGKDAYLNQHIFKVEFGKSDISKMYLKYAVESKIAEMSKNAHGATMKHIVKKDFDNTLIPVPPLSVQESIVSELDMLSGIISKHKVLQEEYDRLEQSIFYDMFGDPVTNEKGWEVKELGSMCEVTSAKRVLIEEVVNEGIPFLRGTELMALCKKCKNEKINFSLFITQEHYDRLKAITGVPKQGDLLIPSINADGLVWIVDTDEPFYFKDGRVLWVHVNNEYYNSIALQKIIHYILEGTYSTMASGATFAELKLFLLRELQVPLPPLSLQQSFADKISAIEQMKAKNKAAQEEAEMLFNERMAYYF